MPSKHDHGLSHDLRSLSRFLDRRRVLKLFGAAGLLPLVGCGSGNRGASADALPGCQVIPAETGGPFPGNGSNGPDALAESGIVRQDIRSSIGTADGTADGILTTVRMRITESGIGCAPLAGYAVYLWQCDRVSDYSMYTGAAVSENYLRGVQATDDDGWLTFTTIFPGCYPGRWPHMHFEIYPSTADATSASNRVRTSQLAIPEDACDAAYAAAGYEASATNLSVLSLESDGVFRDGFAQQLAVATGNAGDGFELTLELSV